MFYHSLSDRRSDIRSQNLWNERFSTVILLLSAILLKSISVHEMWYYFVFTTVPYINLPGNSVIVSFYKRLIHYKLNSEFNFISCSGSSV